MLRWTWDQGRLYYFQFDALRASARVLAQLEGVELGNGPDPLRDALVEGVGLPFLPEHYRVWRNYKRVFGLALLASELFGRLACTEVCHALADDKGVLSTADDYLALLTARTYFPTPALTGYESSGRRVFPLVAILKRLVTNAHKGSPVLSIEEIFSYLVGNEISGEESLDQISALKVTTRQPQGDELRQVREMVIVLSQFSFLKWSSPRLLLDVDVVDSKIIGEITSVAEPDLSKRSKSSSEEILRLGSLGALPRRITTFSPSASVEETGFLEGTRTSRYHLRTERSPLLRGAFFAAAPPPWRCDVCDVELPARYPWVGNLLELHHLLPLASAVRLGRTKTELADLVPVCPNCHRATHSYYRLWLKQNGARDFASPQEALAVYSDAKAAVQV